MTLASGHNYYLVCSETSGGDFFYDVQPVNGGQSIVTGAVSTDNSGNYVVRPNSSFTSSPNSQITFVGPNMIFSTIVTAPPSTTIQVTSPQSGQAVTGLTTFSATVTPALTESQLSYFTFQLDGQPFLSFNSTFTQPSGLADTSVLVSGPQTVIAVYAPPGSTAVTSTPLTFSVSGGAYPLVTSETSGALRNNFTGYVGMKFTTGSDVLQVTGLGRYVYPGNTRAHNIKLVDAVTGTDVLLGNASISTAAATTGQFAFAYLPSGGYTGLFLRAREPGV